MKRQYRVTRVDTSDYGPNVEPVRRIFAARIPDGTPWDAAPSHLEFANGVWKVGDTLNLTIEKETP